MKKLSLASVFLLLSVAALCAEGPDRDAIVRALLERSRLLEDIRFRIPTPLWADYLRETARPAAFLPAPIPMIAEEGTYLLTVAADRKATLAATLRLRVFDPEPCRSVPVLSSALAWEAVKVNELEAKLATAQGWLRFSPDKPGQFLVTAKVPLREATGDGGSLRLSIPPTVLTLARFESPEAWEVELVGDPRKLVGAADRGTQGLFAVTPRDELRAQYRRPLPVQEHPPRYELRGDVAWNLDAGGQQVSARLAIAIVGGRTERIDLVLPPSAERVSVSGPDVRETQPVPGGATVFLRGRIAEQTSLSVAYELPAAKGNVQRFGELGVRDGHWAGGTLVVTNTAGGSEALASSASGLRPLALGGILRTAAALLAGPPALAYAITGRNWSAEVDVLDLGEFALRESIADLAHYELTFRDHGTMLCKATYEVRNRSRQFLRLDLPKGSRVLLARVNEKSCPLSPIEGAPDAYRLPLVRSMASVKGLVSFPVEIVLLCRLAPGDEKGGLGVGGRGLGVGGRGSRKDDPGPSGDGRELPAADIRHSSLDIDSSFVIRHSSFLERRGELALRLPRIDLPIAYAWCESYLPEGLRVSKWSGLLQRVEKYSSETATASLGYGSGQLAEGYAEKARPAPEKAPPPPKAEPKPEAKPAPKRPVPRETPKPATATAARRAGFLGILRGGMAAPAPVSSSSMPAKALRPALKEPGKPRPAPEPAKEALGLYHISKERLGGGSSAKLAAKTPSPAKGEVPEDVSKARKRGKEPAAAAREKEGVRRDFAGEEEATPPPAKAPEPKVEPIVPYEPTPRPKGKAKFLDNFAARPDLPPPPKAKAKDADKLYAPPELAPPPAPSQPAGESAALLGRNYYRAGKSSYDRGDYTGAAEAFQNVEKFAPSSVEAGNARLLLSNIKLARGDLRLESRAEKAAGAQVKRELAAATRPLEEQQKQLLESGLEAVREGNADEAKNALEAAVTLGEQLIAQGADAGDQAARLRAANVELANLEKQQKARGAGAWGYAAGGARAKEGRFDQALFEAVKSRQAKTAAGGRPAPGRAGEARPVELTEGAEELQDLQKQLGEFAPEEKGPPAPTTEPPSSTPVLPLPRTPLRRTEVPPGEALKRIKVRDKALKRVVATPDDEGKGRGVKTEAAAIEEDREDAYNWATRPGATPAERAAQDILKRYQLETEVKENEKRFRAAQHARLAKDRLDMGDVNGALRDFGKAVDLDPASKEAQEGLRKARSMLQKAGEKLGDVAADYARQRAIALDVQRTELESMFAEAKAQYNKGQYRDAVEAFARVAARARFLSPNIDVGKTAAEAELYVAKAMAKIDSSRPADAPAAPELLVPYEPSPKRLLWRLKDTGNEPDYVGAITGGEVKEPPPWMARIRDALSKKVSFDFVETPLQDCLTFLGSLVDVTFVLDAKAVKDEPKNVTLRVNNVRLEDALNRMLALVGLRYDLRDEAIFVTRPERPEKKGVARLPDIVGDLSEAAGERDALAKAFGLDEKDLAPDWQWRLREAARKKVSFDFVETPVQDVVAFLGSLTDVDMILDPRVAKEPPTVTLRVSDMRFDSALRWALRSAGLTFAVKEGAIYVTKPEPATGKTVMHMYNVTDLTIDVKSFKDRQQALAADGGYSSTGAIPKSVEPNYVRSIHADGGAAILQPSKAPTTAEMDAIFNVPAAPVTREAPPLKRPPPVIVYDERDLHPEWEVLLRARLAKKVSFDFVETPLQDVLTFLGGLTDAPLVLDTEAVKDERPMVTLRVTDRRLDQALSWVCKLNGLSYDLRDEAIFITRPEKITEKLLVRIYDVADLADDFRAPRGKGAEREERLTGPSLVEFLRKTVAPGTWDEDPGLGGKAIEYQNGKIIVIQTPDAQREIERALNRLRTARGRRGPGIAAPIAQAYDVRDLVRGNVEDAKKLEKALGELAAPAAEGEKQPFTIAYRNGRIVVVHTPTVQEQVGGLLTAFRKSYGPQVEVGSKIARQQARGQVKVANGAWVMSEEANRQAGGVDFHEFVLRNYDWQLEPPAAPPGEEPEAAAPKSLGDLTTELTEKLRFNLGEKVDVHSVNLNVAAPAAAGLGVAFQTGANGVRYAVIDDAQFRTLLELDARQRGARPVVAPNARGQETIVGTDALLANGWAANVTFAAERSNTLDLNGNALRLPHEQCILIDNGTYLTAVRAGAMQHWTEAPAPIAFGDVPQDIPVLRVGRMVRFERTLVQPTDELVIRARYTWSEPR